MALQRTSCELTLITLLSETVFRLFSNMASCAAMGRFERQHNTSILVGWSAVFFELWYVTFS